LKIIIPSVQVPFIEGGAVMMTQGLKNALIEHGHEVQIVTMTFKFSPNEYIIDSINIWKKQDFNEFNGYIIDKVISLQFPAYYVQHPNKTLWLMHQHRAVYDLYDKESAYKESKKLKHIIYQNDTKELQKIKKRYSMSQTISERLQKYNHIDAIPLYHPPLDEDKFYCDESYNYVFFPSRLETLKRQDLLIKAMQYTKTPLKAIIAGIGGQYQNYQNLIDTLHLNHKIKLIGHITQKEKFSFYAHALAVVFPPQDEDYGYITLEAMLSSKPVITCKDSGGALEFVRDNETGFIIEADPKQLALKLDWIYHNRQKSKELGENGLASYRSKNISWHNVVQKLLEN